MTIECVECNQLPLHCAIRCAWQCSSSKSYVILGPISCKKSLTRRSIALLKNEPQKWGSYSLTRRSVDLLTKSSNQTYCNTIKDISKDKYAKSFKTDKV